MPKAVLSSLLLCLSLSSFAGARAPADAEVAADVPVPGTIRLQVDASDIDRNIQRVQERIPVKPGPLTLLYPQWIPGNHAPTGPINQIAGLTLRAGDRVLRWRRDAVDMYAFHVDVPEGTEALDVEFQYFSPTATNQGRIAVTPQMLSLQWHRVLMYPAGHAASHLRIAPEVRLPSGWSFATALEREAAQGATARFRETTLETLVDSPLYAGRHFRTFALDGKAPAPVRLNAMADAPEQLDATPAVLAAHEALVTQADLVFGARPFAHYDFLLATSDHFSGIGLEHLQSSENGQLGGYLLGDSPFNDNDLLAHEYVHAWNGKSRRPAATWTPHYNTPMRNDLLWMYEGQTQYWAFVLAARSGLRSHEQSMAVLAALAAAAEQRAGRRWRNLRDTGNEGIIEFNNAPLAWENWQRAYDFYDEGTLLWLDVDARLRELSSGRRSLDDFARAFFTAPNGTRDVSTYGEQDVIDALAALQPGEDWSAFLRTRIDAHDDYFAAALARAGWKLVHTDEPNLSVADAEDAQDVRDFSHSIGLKIANKDGRLDAVQWDSPAWRAGLARDMQLVAVDGAAYNGDRLRNALVSARRDGRPLTLLVRRADDYRTVSIDYRDGPRQPHLVRIEGTPDRLSAILEPRRRAAITAAPDRSLRRSP